LLAAAGSWKISADGDKKKGDCLDWPWFLFRDLFFPHRLLSVALARKSEKRDCHRDSAVSRQSFGQSKALFFFS
jgi:hypothetical protein